MDKDGQALDTSRCASDSSDIGLGLEPCSCMFGLRSVSLLYADVSLCRFTLRFRRGDRRGGSLWSQPQKPTEVRLGASRGSWPSVERARLPTAFVSSVSTPSITRITIHYIITSQSVSLIMWPLSEPSPVPLSPVRFLVAHSQGRRTYRVTAVIMRSGWHAVHRAGRTVRLTFTPQNYLSLHLA